MEREEAGVFFYYTISKTTFFFSGYGFFKPEILGCLIPLLKTLQVIQNDT